MKETVYNIYGQTEATSTFYRVDAIPEQDGWKIPVKPFPRFEVFLPRRRRKSVVLPELKRTTSRAYGRNRVLGMRKDAEKFVPTRACLIHRFVSIGRETWSD
jgi:hypothetical protein